MEDVKELKLIKTLSDGTKQYSISSKQDKDIRKEIFAEFAKSGMTIFELKKAEISLEDVFIDLIDQQKETPIKTKEQLKKEKQAQKEKNKEDKMKQKENKKGGDK